MKHLLVLAFMLVALQHTAAGAAVTESPDDDDDWEDSATGSTLGQEADDDGRVYKNPRNSPSAQCPRDEEQATLLNQKCLRKCSSDEDCKSKKKKCLCDGACGMSCIKPDRECPELEKPELGDIAVSGRLFGDKAVYSCPHGYHVVGLQSRSCQADGQWAGQPPACKQNIYCLTPPHIEHARHSALPEQATFDLDATIQYHCHTGYSTTGFPRAKCLAIEGQASWYGPDITCEPRSCGPPGDLPHGWVTAECHTFGCRAALHCGAGFELVGRAERFCQPDGAWAPNELPNCVLVTAVQCPPPDAPRHGRAIFTSLAYNSIVSYECKYGYRLLGDNTRRCGADKKWSGAIPSCKEINCNHPGRLYNGWLENIEAGTGLGASIIFRCHDGMRMEGNSSTLCLSDGTWTYPVPKCLAPCVVPHVTQGRIILVPSNISQETNETSPSPSTQIIGSSTMVHHGEALIVDCDKNYEFLSNNPAVTCNNGTWTQIPKCQPARCKRLPKPPRNGMVVAPKTEHGMKARFHCKDGFALRGPDLLQCSFGNWTGEMPFCQEVYCPFPGYIAYGKVLLVGNMGLYDYRPYVRKVVNNKQIMYDCDKGYVLSEGPPGATCIGGQWSPKELPACTPGQHPRLRWSRRRRRSIEFNQSKYGRSAFMRKYYHHLRKRSAEIFKQLAIEDYHRRMDMQDQEMRNVQNDYIQYPERNILSNMMSSDSNGPAQSDSPSSYDGDKYNPGLDTKLNTVFIQHVRAKRSLSNKLVRADKLSDTYDQRSTPSKIHPFAFTDEEVRGSSNGYRFFGLRPRAKRDVRNRQHYRNRLQKFHMFNHETRLLNEMKRSLSEVDKNENDFLSRNLFGKPNYNFGDPNIYDGIGSGRTKRQLNEVTPSFIAKKVEQLKRLWEERALYIVRGRLDTNDKRNGNFQLNSELKIDPKSSLSTNKTGKKLELKKMTNLVKIREAQKSNSTKRNETLAKEKIFKDLPKVSSEDLIKRMKRTSRKTEKLNQTTATVPKSNKDVKGRQQTSQQQNMPPTMETETTGATAASETETVVAVTGGPKGSGRKGRVKGPCDLLPSEPYANIEIVKFGREPNVSYSSGTIVRVACGKGYNLNLGFNATAKCVRGRWKPAKPICEIQPCHIPVTENGIFTLAGTEGGVVENSDVPLNETSDVLNGQVVQFSCEPGYNIQGASNLRCWHGDWAVTGLPECIAAPCELPWIRHGVYTAGYRGGLTIAHGASVAVHCEMGFAPGATFHCELGALRPNSGDLCMPSQGSVGIVREGAGIGQDFRGGSDIVREDFDELEYPTSVAGPLDCGPPARVQGTLIYRDGTPLAPSATTYPHGTEVTFRCIASIMGEKSTWKIVCERGSWIGKSVTCEEEDSAPSGLLNNSTCTFRNSEPNVISFFNDQEVKEEVVEFPAGTLLISRCVDIGKYAMTGPNERRCLGGEWDGTKPSCFGLNQENDYAMEKPPTILFRHQLGPIAQSNDGRLIVYPGTILHMECLWMRRFGNPKWNVSHEYRKYPEGWSADPGRDGTLEYRLSIFHAAKDDSGIYTCVTPARQSHQVEIVVEAVHCPPLPIRRGLISSSQSTKMGAEVQFSCANGNSLIGSALLSCLPSGNWSAPLPLCESVECGEVVVVGGTTGSASKLRVSVVSRGVGGRAAFSCTPGWGLRGPAETHCLPSGEWAPPFPTCTEVSCPPPVAPANGYLLGRAPFRAGDVVQFNCNPAHMMQGQPIVACQDNARWSSETPKCIQACPYPGTTISGRMSSVKFYYKIGETISFTCEPGLRLKGAPMLRCLRSGKWSNAIPICARESYGNETFVATTDDSDKIALMSDDPSVYNDSLDFILPNGTQDAKKSDFLDVMLADAPSQFDANETIKVAIKSTTREVTEFDSLSSVGTTAETTTKANGSRALLTTPVATLPSLRISTKIFNFQTIKPTKTSKAILTTKNYDSSIATLWTLEQFTTPKQIRKTEATTVSHESTPSLKASTISNESSSYNPKKTLVSKTPFIPERLDPGNFLPILLNKKVKEDPKSGVPINIQSNNLFSRKNYKNIDADKYSTSSPLHIREDTRKLIDNLVLSTNNEESKRQLVSRSEALGSNNVQMVKVTNKTSAVDAVKIVENVSNTTSSTQKYTDAETR